MTEDADLRSVKIKLGTLRRLRKEFDMYRADADKQSAKVEEMRASNADPHDLKYAENILEEAKGMVPDTRSRLEAALVDLRKAVEKGRASLVGQEELAFAETELGVAQSVLA